MLRPGNRAPPLEPPGGGPVVWLFGGLDPTGGAGLLRDLWTLRALLPTAKAGAVVSAWTWQGTGAPARAQARPLSRIAEEFAALPRPDAVKVGLVPARLIDEGLLALLADASQGAPIVLDPVLAASDGGDLGARPAQLLELASIAALVTPNLAEARAMALEGVAEDWQGAREEAREEARLDARLLGALAQRSRGSRGPAWLLKGGHAPALAPVPAPAPIPASPEPARSSPSPEVVDRLWLSGQVHEFRRPRQPGPDPRGTGCALATAIAVGVASSQRRRDPPDRRADPRAEAVRQAIAWLDQTRLAWRIGRDGRPHLPVPAPAPAPAPAGASITAPRRSPASRGSSRG